MPESDDPTVVHTVAVTAADAVSAFEARTRNDRPAVLRLTPPFSGRMRARIHVADGEYAGDPPHPIHIDPRTLLDGAPPYPDPDGVEDDLRADPDADYSAAAHRERYAAAVEAWRERARGAIADAVVVETPAGDHEVDVAVLG